MSITVEQAQQSILAALQDEAGKLGSGRGQQVRDLAEAWAWLEFPNNSHGGSVVVTSK